MKSILQKQKGKLILIHLTAKKGKHQRIKRVEKLSEKGPHPKHYVLQCHGPLTEWCVRCFRVSGTGFESQIAKLNLHQSLR